MRAILAILTAAWLGSDAIAGSTACDRAAIDAARTYAVPAELLLAMTRLESGRDRGQGFAPWPWTIGVAGAGYWASDASSALAFARQALMNGAPNLDIGCFQLNLRWHGRNFASLDEMLDPQANADQSARYLRALYDELGDWWLAAGAWHSRTPHHAEAYLERLRASLQVDEADLVVSSRAQPALGAISPGASRARPLFGG